MILRPRFLSTWVPPDTMILSTNISAIFDQRAKIVFMDIRFACRHVCVVTKGLFALAEYMCH